MIWQNSYPRKEKLSGVVTLVYNQEFIAKFCSKFNYAKILRPFKMLQLVSQLSMRQTINGRSIWKWQVANHNLTHKIVVTTVMTFYVILKLFLIISGLESKK